MEKIANLTDVGACQPHSLGLKIPRSFPLTLFDPGLGSWFHHAGVFSAQNQAGGGRIRPHVVLVFRALTVCSERDRVKSVITAEKGCAGAGMHLTRVCSFRPRVDPSAVRGCCNLAILCLLSHLGRAQFCAPLWMVTAATRWKDACSLEEKL